MVEHRGPIHRIAVSPQNQHFATVSSDRSVKLWDCEKLEGKAMINQSKATCTRIGMIIPKIHYFCLLLPENTFLILFSGEKLHCVTFCGEENIVCATSTGMVHSIAVQTMSNPVGSAGSQESISTLDLDEPSRVMDMASFQKCLYTTDIKNLTNLS